MASRTSLSQHWQHATLTVTYAALTIYFLAINLQPVWLPVALVMLLASGGLLWARATGDERAPARLLAALPPLYLALPLPLAASWFAGDIALGRPGEVNYWHAFGLWLAAIALFVALLLPWRALVARRNLPDALAAVPWLEVAAVAFVTLVAFGVRIADLGGEPNPISGDEASFANHAIDALHTPAGNLFSTGAPFDQPSSYFYMEAGFFKLFGVGIFAARLPSVLFGVSMVPLLYLLLREQFDRRVAFVAAAFLAVYHLHVHFSRIGLNNISAAWIAIVTLYFAARATRTQKPLDFGLAGAAAGLSLYSFVAARVVPPILGAYLAWYVLTNWRFLRDNAGNVLVLAAGFFIVAAPQGMFFINDQDAWYSGTRWANIFANNYLEQRTDAGDTALTVVVEQFRIAFGTLAIYPEVYHHYNAGVPIIDPLRFWHNVPGPTFWLLCIGVAVAALRLIEARYLVWPALLIATVILGAAVVTPPPSSARLTPITPAVAALVAIGLVALADAVMRWRPHLSTASYAGIAGVMLLLSFIHLQFYFGDFLPADRFVAGNNQATYAIGDYLHDRGTNYAGYFFGLPRIYANDPTIRFIGRDRTLIDVTKRAVLLPPYDGPAPDLTLIALPERQDELAPFIAACPGGRMRDVYWKESDKEPAFRAYERPGGVACVHEANLVAKEGQPLAPPPPQTSDVPTANDNRRTADLELLRQALERYYDDHGAYPNTSGNVQAICYYAGSDAGCDLGSYIDPIPIDPLEAPYLNGYFYASDGARFSLFSLYDGPTEPISTDTCFFFNDQTALSTPIRLCLSGAR